MGVEVHLGTAQLIGLSDGSGLLCGEEEETISHIFFDCKFSTEVFLEAYKAINEVIRKMFGNPFPSVLGGDIRLGDIMDEIQKFRKGFKSWRLLCVLFVAICWHLWQEINSRWMVMEVQAITTWGNQS